VKATYQGEDSKKGFSKWQSNWSM